VLRIMHNEKVCVCERVNLRMILTLVDLQLDAQNPYLFTYNILIKILYMFRALPCAHLQEVYVVIVHMQPLVSSLSAGRLVHLS
jgi:hypothetical protein